MKYTILLFLFILGGCAKKSPSSKVADFTNTIYKFGFKTDSSSTGPLSNSAFIMKLNDTLPSLFLTAHHTAAFIDYNQYVKWNQIENNMKNGWAWSVHDSAYNFKIGKNLPVPNAETMKLDIAAFYAGPDIPYLKPAKMSARVGDTTYLFSKIDYQNKTTLRNRGVVIYATDSVLVYELTDFNMAKIMSGTSGSCVINKEGEVVSNSYAGFTIPNEEVKQQLVASLPLISKLQTRNGKTYGVGVPIELIEKSLLLAFRQSPKQ